MELVNALPSLESFFFVSAVSGLTLWSLGCGIFFFPFVLVDVDAAWRSSVLICPLVLESFGRQAGILRRVTLCYRVSLMTENDEEGGMDWGAELLARSGGGTLSSLSGSGSTKGVAKIASLATKTKIEKMR